jgi:ABC-type amino acid transport substrate-binding protein
MHSRCLRLAPLLLCLAALPATGRDLAEIKAQGTLRVLGVSPLPTDEFLSSLPQTDRPGFDYEILDGFASLQRVKLELIRLPGWDGLIPALRAGRGDIVAGRFTVTDSRREQVDFCSEVFPSRYVVLTRQPHKIIGSLEELRAERVGTVKGTSLAEAVAAIGVPKANVDDVPSGHLPDALRDGRVAAVVIGVENAIAAQRVDPLLQMGLFVGPPRSLAYAVRKGDLQLLKALNEYVENVRRTQTWGRLVVKYFGEAAPDILKKSRAE